MTFLFCLAVLQWTLLILAFSASRLIATGKLKTGPAFAQFFVCFLIGGLLSSPLVLMMLRASEFENGKAVTMMSAWTTPLLFAAGGVAAAAFFAFRLYRQHKQGSAGFLAIGPNVIALAAGLYVAAAAADHLAFIQAGPDAGYLNWGFFAEEGQVTDVQCAHDTMLVAHIDADEVSYRCPTSVVMNSVAAAPFVPWPSYTEGKSRLLAQRLHRMREEARAAERAVQP